jgi:hypothetical protein
LGFASALTGAIIMAGIFLLQPDKDLFEFQPAHQMAALTDQEPAGHTKAIELQPSWNGKDRKVKAKVIPISPAPIIEVNSEDVDLLTILEQENALSQSAVTADDITSPDNTLGSDIGQANNYESEPAPIVPLKGLPRTETNLSPRVNAAAIQATSTEDLNLASTARPAAIASQVNANDQQLTEAEAIPATASQKSKGKTSKWSVQYYATPSISYRFIDEERNYDQSMVNSGNLPPYYMSKVNQLVNHTPKLGIEGGVAWQYQVTERLAVKFGVQANYRQFGISAYQEAAASPAMLRLDQGMTYDTVINFSSINNFSGDKPAELTNSYLQFAVPVGFELALANGKKAQFVVGTTLQPTYVAAQQTWLLSSDYQHYTKESSLMKRFNMNMGVEMMIRFKGAGLNWQVGPQVRYQMQPSVDLKYPIREHLIDYGLKFGVTKTLR